MKAPTVHSIRFTTQNFSRNSLIPASCFLLLKIDVHILKAPVFLKRNRVNCPRPSCTFITLHRPVAVLTKQKTPEKLQTSVSLNSKLLEHYEYKNPSIATACSLSAEGRPLANTPRRLLVFNFPSELTFLEFLKQCADRTSRKTSSTSMACSLQRALE